MKCHVIRGLVGVGLLTLAVLLLSDESGGESPPPTRRPPRNVTSPGYRPSGSPSRPKTVVKTSSTTKAPAPATGMPAKHLPRPYTAPIEGPKSLLRTAPKLGMPSYAYSAPLPRTVEWDLVPIVVEGRVQSVRRTTKDGKASPSGSRLSLGLAVARIFKGGGLSAGDRLAVQGWASGESRQEFIPGVGEEVIAFLRSPRSGHYDLLGKHGFQRKSAGAARRSTADLDEP